MLLGFVAANAQNALIIPDYFDPIYPEEFCNNCFTNIEFSSGVKYSIGIGLVKPVSERFDLVTNLGFGYWNYEVTIQTSGGIWYEGFYDQYKEKMSLFNFSVGERFHLFQLKNSSFYSGLNFNVQLYTQDLQKNAGLSIEPTFGWRKSLTTKSELFIAVGYDQHLTSYSEISNRRPGKLAFNLGYNIVLQSKKRDSEDLIKK